VSSTALFVASLEPPRTVRLAVEHVIRNASIDDVKPFFDGIAPAWDILRNAGISAPIDHDLL
jgi:hypothetical protein